MSELTEEEKHIEALCDEERYMELHSDVQEKALHEGGCNTDYQLNLL